MTIVFSGTNDVLFELGMRTLKLRALVARRFMEAKDKLSEKTSADIINYREKKNLQTC